MSEHDIRAVSEHYASILRNYTVQCCAASHIGFNKIIGISLRLLHSKINSPSWLMTYMYCSVLFVGFIRIYCLLYIRLWFHHLLICSAPCLAFYSSRMAERGERSSWSVNKTDLVTSLAEYLNLKHTRTHTHTHTSGLIITFGQNWSNQTGDITVKSRGTPRIPPKS